MKKIYYLEKHPVKIGDVIEHNGFRVTVTEELIRLNPELFIVKDAMQELLDEAKRRYPIGTVYKHFNSEYTTNSPDMLTVSEMDHHFSFGASIWVTSEEYNGIVYEDGEWAEILPLKFTTEDGVDIYGDMKTYAVAKGDLDVDNPEIYGGNSTSFKYFYHKENALAYIKKHREKSLEDYESSLSLSVWGWFKIHEPKLYYIKILQLIADHLNDGWVADFSKGGTKWFIKEVDSDWTILHNYGAVYFKSKELSEKARAILGNNVKYLFNQHYENR